MKRTKRVWTVSFIITDDLKSQLKRDFSNRSVLYTQKDLEKSIRYVLQKEFRDIAIKNVIVSDARKD